MAIRLRTDAEASLWWTAACTETAWLAVQAHSAAMFIAAPLIGSYVVADLIERRVGQSLQQSAQSSRSSRSCKFRFSYTP
ncbi:MAG: hypothetical protein QM736_15515 [Vicinamibacterales bacterium]